MKKYSVWKDEEVKKLFFHIENFRKFNKSLISAFASFAKETGRKQNSVRNYYYTELSELARNEERRKYLGINLAQHEISNPESFSENETINLITEILRLTSMGFSVRKACLKLSDNDVSKMVRLQNKYRNILQSKPEIIKKCSETLKNKGFLIETTQKEAFRDKIIKMPAKKQQLSDSEITSLFLGLVKLVKKNAKEEAEEYFGKESEFANNALRKTIVKLTSAECENKVLNEKYKLVVKQKEELTHEVQFLKSEIASLMKDKMTHTSEKMDSLKEYLKNRPESPSPKLKT